MRRSSTMYAFSLAMYSVAFILLLFRGLASWPVDALSADGLILLDMRESWMHMAMQNKTYALPGSGRRLWGGWDVADNNPCAWAGVRCNDKLTVEELDLSGWALGGSFIGEQLLSLHNMKELDLSANNLVGPLPDWIGNLSLLTRLDVSSNKMHGKIPPTISKLQHLRFLFLQDNVLEGEIPLLDGLSSLQFLSLSGNNLTGQVPAGVQKLTHLVSLDLSRNSRLGGEIPDLSGLTHLESLDLSSNNFSVLRDFSDVELQSLANLKRLNMSRNYGTGGPIPAGFMYLPNMESLDLSHNNLTGEIPQSTTWGSKYYLDLSRNKLEGPLPVGLLRSAGKFPPTLKLSHNSLNGSIGMPTACSVSSPCNFETLDLSYNRLVGDINNLLLSPQLVELSVRGNSFTGEINITRLLGLTSLRVLDLSGVLDLTSVLDLRSILDKRTGQYKVSMRATNEFPNPLQSMLEGLPLLTELRLMHVDLSGLSLPRALSSVQHNLRVMDLRHCNLWGEIRAYFFNGTYLPELHSVDLSYNHLHVVFPTYDYMGHRMVDYEMVHYDSVLRLYHQGFKYYHYDTFDVTGNRGRFPDAPGGPCHEYYDYDTLGVTGNRVLCGGLSGHSYFGQSQGVERWERRLLLAVVAEALVISVGSCILVWWRWRVYAKKHQQDVDLIATLLERDVATLMPLRELKRATANFSESCQIGVGGFGTVYKGELCDGTIVAIKRSNKRQEKHEDKQEFLNEVSILSLVNHRHLVKLIGCCLENKVSVLVFEYVSNGTLLDHLRGTMGDIRLSWKHRLRIAVQTADALNYLHSAADPPIFHRDVKSANILLDADLNAKVADFGISKLAPVNASHVSTVKIQGTMGYIDPQYYTSYQLTAKSDVYSFGVVLLELISAQSAVDSQRGDEDAMLVSLAVRLSSCGDLHNLIDPLLVEMSSNSETEKESILGVGKLAIQCLAMRSRDRPSMKEVLKELQSLWLQYDPVGATDELRHINRDISDGNGFYNSSLSNSSSCHIQITSLSAPNHPAAVVDRELDTFQRPHST